MILNDKFFNRDVEIKKCFENDVPLVMFDKETKTYVDCENPNFEECDLLKIKLPNFNNNCDETVNEFLKKNKQLIEKLHYKDETYIIIQINSYNPYEITYNELSFVEMINERIENYTFKGTRDECHKFLDDFYKKLDNCHHFIHRHFPSNDIKDFIYKLKYVHMNNFYFPSEDLNELYNLLYVNNDTWDKYLKEQRHKELEEKDREFNENLIYHMVEEEKQ